MAAAIKSIVSKKKCRYKEGKFDLDLTYIDVSKRIIAMGYPAENVEAIYRNDYHHVKEFLDKKHGGHYWVYNLCSEQTRIYDKSKFDGRVSCYAFDDHHPPVFSLIQPFCDEVSRYLDADENNVAVVHCKAGKGRTGVMICCYLLYSKQSPNAESVLRYYGDKRTTDQKGVTIPSQRRYITYYDAMNRKGLEYKPVKLYLRDIVLDPAPNFSTGQSYIYFEVTQRGRKEPYVSKHFLFHKNDRNVSLSVNPPLLLTEDVKFEFSSKAKFDNIFGQKLAKGDKPFHFWLNTFFVDMQLDGGLAHDLTDTSPIKSSSQGHVHHASGSSEDSSTDDIPLKPTSNGGLSVTFRDAPREANRQTSVPVTNSGIGNGAAGDQEVTNLVKNASISDDHLLQDRRARQTETFSCNNSNTVSHISSMGPLSTSDENTASNLSEGCDSSSTTTESFIQQRLRHESMPQARVSTSGIHHDHLEASHSNAESSMRPANFFSRHHATITSNSAASLENSNSANSASVQVPIQGKLLSLRLKKGQIDKAHKDKNCRTFPDNFSVTLFLVKPDDQSDTLLDYSLYPSNIMSNHMDHHSTITTAGFNSSMENHGKFTVSAVNNRQRPLTGDSSSSATPSLKSVGQSSQDSVSDDGQEPQTNELLLIKQPQSTAI